MLIVRKRSISCGNAVFTLFLKWHIIYEEGGVVEVINIIEPEMYRYRGKHARDVFCTG